MSDPQQARDRLRELASKLEVNLDDLVGDLLSKPAAKEAPAPIDIPLSDGAIKAAICDSFSTSENWAAGLDRNILERSQLIMIDGRRRLRLSDEARGSILRKAAADDRLRAVLDEADRHVAEAAVLPDTDARNASLRRILKGDVLDLTGAPPADLRAAVAALERLREAPLPEGVPSLPDAQRLLERAELLEPLRMQIGATGRWDYTPDADRFVGRERELTTLRAFVNEIESQGTFETVQRNVTAAGRALRHSLGDDKAEGVRLIVARGGLGKSALIAKFVLDHALHKGDPFPFAYLDFDRASIQARDSRQLLFEVVRQVALQFPQAGAELGALRDDIRQSLTSTTSRRSIDVDPFEEFRRIVRDRITRGARAMLIVFDTVEIAQADAHAMNGLLQFMDRICQGGFTELRLVAAGRAPVDKLLEESYSRRAGVMLTLAPLALDEARRMVERLGKSLLPNEWIETWTTRLAGKKTDLPERREPLSLRVAVETLRDEKPEDRDAQSRRIEELGEQGSENFVGKLYMNRVVGHVTGGDEVRKLAWPGLVMRRVTPDIIRHALAPVLNINPNAATTLFEALASQLWIVSRDGNTLTHQPDLRARTLPLMRRRPEFKDINQAAIAYYAARRDASAQHRAEWIYHRLLANEPAHGIDRDWDEALAPLLKDAVDDFPPGSAEADYLSLRTSDRLLPDELLIRLEPRLALLHVARVGMTKANLTDTTLDPLLLSLPLDAVTATSLPRDAAAARVCLLVKTGRWQFHVNQTGEQYGIWKDHVASAVAYRRARMAATDGMVLRDVLDQTYSQSVSELATIGVLVQDLATARLVGWPHADKLDRLVVRRLRSRSSATDAAVGSALMRTAMIFGYESTAAAARIWAMQAMEVVRATKSGSVSTRELDALLPDPPLEDAARHALTAAGVTWEAYRAQAKGSDRTSLRDPVLAAAVVDAVVRRAERGEPDDLRALREFAAARDEDWLLPFAYASHRATAGKIPPAVTSFLDKHELRQRGFIERNLRPREVPPADVLEVLRKADEASDLDGAARLFLDHGDPTAAEDLRRLLSWQRSWKQATRHLLSPPRL